MSNEENPAGTSAPEDETNKPEDPAAEGAAPPPVEDPPAATETVEDPPAGEEEEQPKIYTEADMQVGMREAAKVSARETLNLASDLAARHPAHSGKSAAQHGTDIANRIRDLNK